MSDPFGIFKSTPEPQHFTPFDNGSWERSQSLREHRAQTYIAGEARDLAEEARDAARLSVEHAARQAATLAAMRKLSEDLASEQRRSKYFEEKQQTFNRRMSWAALLLAGGAIVVPFIVLYLDKVL